MRLVGSLIDRAMFPGTDPSYDMASFEQLFLLKFNYGKDFYKVPCVLFPYHKGSPFLIIYAHGNGSDIGDIFCRLQKLSECVQAHVLGFDYPGYGCAEGKADVTSVDEVTSAVIQFVCSNLGWPLESIILFGCSIGTGPCTRFARNIARLHQQQSSSSIESAVTLNESNHSSTNVKATTTQHNSEPSEAMSFANPSATLSTSLPDACLFHGRKLGGLILQCPYRSIQHAAERFIGKLMARMLVERKWDIETEVLECDCPILWIHGKKDDMFDWQGSQFMYNEYKNNFKMIHLADEGTHLNFDFESDVISPIRAFLKNLVTAAICPPPHFSLPLRLFSNRLKPPQVPCQIPIISSDLAQCQTSINDVLSTWIEYIPKDEISSNEEKTLLPFTEKLTNEEKDNINEEFCSHSLTIQLSFPTQKKNYHYDSSDWFSQNNQRLINIKTGFPYHPLNSLSNENHNIANGGLTPNYPQFMEAESRNGVTPYQIQRLNLDNCKRQQNVSSYPNKGVDSSFISPQLNFSARFKKPATLPLSSVLIDDNRNKNNNQDYDVNKIMKEFLGSGSHSSIVNTLWPWSSLKSTLFNKFQHLLTTMIADVIYRGMSDYCLTERFTRSVYWVRRFYTLRFRHNLGMDLIYKRVEDNGYLKTSTHSQPQTPLPQCNKNVTSYKLDAISIAGFILRINSDNGLLSVEPCPTILQESYDPNFFSLPSPSPLHHTKNDNNGRNALTSSSISQQTMFSSLDYFIVPVYSPPKNSLLFALSRHLAHASVQQQEDRFNCNVTKKGYQENAFVKNALFTSAEVNYNDNEDKDILENINLDEKNRNKWRHYPVASSLSDLTMDFALDFVTQNRRPMVERLGYKFGSYYPFGWDSLISKLLDDWNWFEPRICLTSTSMIPSGHKKHPNLQCKSYSIKMDGWRMHPIWLTPEGRAPLHVTPTTMTSSCLSVKKTPSWIATSEFSTMAMPDHLQALCHTLLSTESSSPNELFSQPVLHMFNDSYFIQTAYFWMGRLDTSLKQNSIFTNDYEIYLQHLTPQNVILDRWEYIKKCQQFDSRNQSKVSICYHQVFHKVLLRPGFIVPIFYSYVDAIWRLSELITGISCKINNTIPSDKNDESHQIDKNNCQLSQNEPISTPTGVSMSDEYQNNVVTSDTSSSMALQDPSSLSIEQASFLVNLSFSISLVRRLLNIAKSVHNSKLETPPGTEALLVVASAKLPPMLNKYYPGIISPCLRLLDELRFAILSGDMTTIPSTPQGLLGYTQEIRGWQEGCEFNSGHCYLIAELENVLALLYDALETVDYNVEPGTTELNTYVNYMPSKVNLKFDDEGYEIEKQPLWDPLTNQIINGSPALHQNKALISPYVQDVFLRTFLIIQKKARQPGVWWSSDLTWIQNYLIPNNYSLVPTILSTNAFSYDRHFLHKDAELEYKHNTTTDFTDDDQTATNSSVTNFVTQEQSDKDQEMLSNRLHFNNYVSSSIRKSVNILDNSSHNSRMHDNTSTATNVVTHTETQKRITTNSSIATSIDNYESMNNDELSSHIHDDNTSIADNTVVQIEDYDEKCSVGENCNNAETIGTIVTNPL